MEKSKEEFVGKTVMEESGTQYFVVGKYKIKVSEHFPERGKRLIISWRTLCTVPRPERYFR